MPLYLKSTLVSALLLLVPAGACNDVGDCPAAASIRPCASCSGNDLQCPYTLPGGDDAGTETSCVCQGGTWSCPTAGDDAGGDDATADDGPSPEASPEANPEASAEASPEASSEAGTDASLDGAMEAAGD